MKHIDFNLHKTTFSLKFCFKINIQGNEYGAYLNKVYKNIRLCEGAFNENSHFLMHKISASN